jgi:hypothetical protein
VVVVVVGGVVVVVVVGGGVTAAAGHVALPHIVITDQFLIPGVSTSDQ